jgi:hypothetical protein
MISLNDAHMPRQGQHPRFLRFEASLRRGGVKSKEDCGTFE